jgi:hypothetical protein
MTMIAKTVLLAIGILAVAGAPNAAPAAERVETVPTRPGVTMKVVIRNGAVGIGADRDPIRGG